MLTALGILALLAVAAALVGLAWLWLSVSWEVVEDDDASRRLHGKWGGLRPRSRLLTYRRDRRGRFRRHRR